MYCDTCITGCAMNDGQVAFTATPSAYMRTVPVELSVTVSIVQPLVYGITEVVQLNVGDRKYVISRLMLVPRDKLLVALNENRVEVSVPSTTDWKIGSVPFARRTHALMVNDWPATGSMDVEAMDMFGYCALNAKYAGAGVYAFDDSVPAYRASSPPSATVVIPVALFVITPADAADHRCIRPGQATDRAALDAAPGGVGGDGMGGGSGGRGVGGDGRGDGGGEGGGRGDGGDGGVGGSGGGSGGFGLGGNGGGLGGVGDGGNGG